MAATGHESNNMQARFNNALQCPLARRPDEVVAVFRDCSIKELQAFYPVLIENIFGISATSISWDLKNISRYQSPTTFEAIFRFLHPQGAFFDVAYKLLSDVYLKYHCSLSYLPRNFRQLIEQGNAPPFYVDKLHTDPVTRAPMYLLLNSFELFMFHFAFYLVSPWQVRVETSTGNNETVYLHLSDQYISHFLPIETSVVLPIVSLLQHTPRSPPPQVQPVRVSKLFKSSALKLNFNTTTPSVVTQPHAEIWRSETLLHIVIYFWLYVSDTPKMLDTSQFSSPPSPYSSFNANTSMQRTFTQEWQEARATSEHLRVVRNLIKHMHYFANNIRNDGSVMDEMRRSIRSVLQVPIYNFLRHNINHWPLDSSFHLLLETYLSYIQPWRYQRYNSVTQAGESTNVDASWLPYITDNLEAYTAVVSELLSRFLRMDLTSPRHAHMVYRLAKVLSEPRLPFLLHQVDVAAQSRGDQENHVPLFTSDTTQKVRELLRTMASAIAIVSAAASNAQENSSSGFGQTLREWFHGTSNDDYSSTDRQNTIAYLDHSVKWLSAIFDVTPPDVPETGAATSVEPSLLDPVLAQRRAVCFKYGGNPDLEPIRTTEVASLVRLMHRVSSSINEMYGHEIAELWHREDLMGRVSRQFLAPPCQYFYFHKTGPGNPAPRVSLFLPPRVCLRPLASKGVIFLVVFLILFPYLFGYNHILSYMTFLTVFVSWVFAKAVLSPYLTRGSSDAGPFVPLDVSFQE